MLLFMFSIKGKLVQVRVDNETSNFENSHSRSSRIFENESSLLVQEFDEGNQGCWKQGGRGGATASLFC